MSLSWRHGAEDIVSLAGTVEVYHGRFVYVLYCIVVS